MDRGLLMLFLLLLIALGVESKITCKDNNNEPVEWFIVYKLPVKFNLSASKEWPFPPHLYTDSNDNQFNMSKLTLNVSNQAVAYTLQQAYSNHKSADVGYIMYNDEKPTQAGGGYTGSYGHTKGVTIFDKESGIWLVHSVPKFPPPTNSSYMFPDNAVYYGQHLLCIQLNTAQDVSYLGDMLMYNEPWIYDQNLPILLRALYPSMADVIAEVRTNQTNRSLNLDTPTQGTFFTVFAKNRHFDADNTLGSQLQTRPATDSPLFPETQTLLNKSQPTLCSTGQYASEPSLIHGRFKFAPSTQDMMSAACILRIKWAIGNTCSG